MTTTQKTPEHIHATSQQFVIRPEDEDLFVLTGSEVVKACQAHDSSVQCFKQFEELVQKLGKFTATWKSRVAESILTIRRSDILFVMVSKSEERDDDLSEALVELEIGIANDADLSLLRFCTLSLPCASGDEVSQFVSPFRLDLIKHFDANV